MLLDILCKAEFLCFVIVVASGSPLIKVDAELVSIDLIRPANVIQQSDRLNIIFYWLSEHS